MSYNRKIPLSVGDAKEILGYLGSCEDPIIWRGRETSPSEMACLDQLADARRLRIQFSPMEGRGLIKGTLVSMIRDRLG